MGKIIKYNPNPHSISEKQIKEMKAREKKKYKKYCKENKNIEYEENIRVSL